jgi:hypothetical protein
MYRCGGEGHLCLASMDETNRKRAVQRASGRPEPYSTDCGTDCELAGSEAESRAPGSGNLRFVAEQVRGADLLSFSRFPMF